MTTMSQPCWFLMLPDELKLQVTSYLQEKRDLYNLAVTSRACEDTVLTRLYASVDIEVPQNISAYWKTGKYGLYRPHVVHAIRDLSVRNAPVDVKRSSYIRRRLSDAGCVNGQIRKIVEAVPSDQLMALSFLHRTAFSPSSLHTLALIHGNSLRELRVYELEPFPTTSTVLPTGLTTFQCHSVGDGKAAAQLVHANQKSLERLRLGQEKELVEAYKRTRIGYLEQVPSGADILHESIRLGELPALLELDLCGIDLSALVPKTGEEGHDFCRLQRLSIESCPASVLFLEAIAAAFYDAQNPGDPSRIRADPRLKEFLLRSETPTTALKETLVRFLASFRGLETLSLLLENAALLDGPSTMIAEHGPTLRTLVMESRIQPRESLTHDTSRPFGVGAPSEELWEQSINDICQLCPNLEELGTGFPWGIETVRLRRTKLPSLKNLKTIHIRNFPSSQVLLQLGDYTIKEHATKFIEWVVSPTKGGNKPSLETLAIGPTLYESRWRSSNTRRQPPEYLKTHYFWLDFGQTRFGRWSPMVSAVSDTCMAEMRGDKLSKGVFEQIWLR